MNKIKNMMAAAVEGDYSGNDMRNVALGSLRKLQSPIFQDMIGIGRIIEEDDYNVWGCSPIYDEQGNIHVYYARWKACYNRLGWVAACEVCHAVAEHVEGPY